MIPSAYHFGLEKSEDLLKRDSAVLVQIDLRKLLKERLLQSFVLPLLLYVVLRMLRLTHRLPLHQSVRVFFHHQAGADTCGLHA